MLSCPSSCWDDTQVCSSVQPPLLHFESTDSSVLCVCVKPTLSGCCSLCKGQTLLHLLLIFSLCCCSERNAFRKMRFGCRWWPVSSMIDLSRLQMEGPERRSGSAWSKLLNYRCFPLLVCLPLSLAGVICIQPSDVKCLLACARLRLPLPLLDPHTSVGAPVAELMNR